MKYLVIGGAGFIGSHLCERLSRQPGCKVFSLDSYLTGSKDNEISGVTYIYGNSLDIDALVSFSPDVIFHFGEYSRVEQSFDDIDLVWKSNQEPIFNILRFALRHKAKLIYAGSSTKFGDGGASMSESPYAWTKAKNTELVERFGDWFGLKFAIVYFYNVYGGREIKAGRYATLIAKCVALRESGGVLDIVSPGTQRRNFTYIDDVIEGVMLVANGGFGDGFGIGNNESYSIVEIANLFGLEYRFVNERRGNRLAGPVHSEKLRKLGWEPKVSISDYVTKVLGG